jgi:predicted O-methyltransferase YrrM
VWFAKRADLLVSFESDAQWYSKVGGWLAKENLIDHTHLVYWQGPPYYLPANLPRRYDIILVDGRHRVEFAKWCLKFTHPESIIIFDDIEREKYAPIFKEYEENGLKFVRYTKGAKRYVQGGEVLGYGITYTGIFSWLD